MFCPLAHPIFLISAFIFGLHQFLQKVIHINIPIVDNYVDNLLCFPILLPLLLVEWRWHWMKDQHYFFSKIDLACIVLVLIFIFEVVFPHLSTQFTADVWDVPFYLTGAFVFWKFQNQKR